MALMTKVGGAESNSFITLAEMTTLLASLPDETDSWEDLEEEAQEYRLKLGAQAIGFLPLAGSRAYCSQALSFPRTSQGNVKVIPDEVKEAQAFLTYSVIHRGLAGRPSSVVEAESGARVSQVSLGGLLSVSFAGTAISAGNILDKLIRSSQFPLFLGMKKFLSQIRGGSVSNADEEVCSTTTTSTTTTTTT